MIFSGNRKEEKTFQKIDKLINICYDGGDGRYAVLSSVDIFPIFDPGTLRSGPMAGV
jgi:hypothetical protein